MNQLLLCVTYTIKSGMRDEFIREVLSSGVAEKIHKENGCLGYAYYRPVLEEDSVLLVEKWDNEASQRAHLKQPHMETLKSIKERYVVDTHLEKSFL